MMWPHRSTTVWARSRTAVSCAAAVASSIASDGAVTANFIQYSRSSRKERVEDEEEEEAEKEDEAEEEEAEGAVEALEEGPLVLLLLDEEEEVDDEWNEVPPERPM